MYYTNGTRIGWKAPRRERKSGPMGILFLTIMRDAHPSSLAPSWNVTGFATCGPRSFLRFLPSPTNSTIESHPKVCLCKSIKGNLLLLDLIRNYKIVTSPLLRLLVTPRNCKLHRCVEERTKRWGSTCEEGEEGYFDGETAYIFISSNE